jgi:hypothetical protein
MRKDSKIKRASIKMNTKQTGPKILFLDVETSPLEVLTWGLFDQNIGLNQIQKDSTILSWAAKWFESSDGTIYGPHNKMMYMDCRFEKDVRNDKDIVKGIWSLLDSADIIIGQNSKRFDIKKLNARFLAYGLSPPSSYKQVDTLALAKKYYSLTSNKLEYMTSKLCTKYKKLPHKEYPGFELWKACLAGDRKAWDVMEEYNKHDVFSTEELYNIFAPWDNSINMSLYLDTESNVCKCGSTKFKRNGFHYSGVGKFQRYKCSKCKCEVRDRKNLFSKEKLSSLKVKV